MIKLALVLITLLFTTNSFAYGSDDYIQVNQPVKTAHQLVHEYAFHNVFFEVWAASDGQVCHKCKEGWGREFAGLVAEAVKLKMHKEAFEYRKYTGTSLESALLKVYYAYSDQEIAKTLRELGINIDAMFFEYRRKNERK